MEHQTLLTTTIFQGCFIVLPFLVVYMVGFGDYIILGSDTLHAYRQEVSLYSWTPAQHGNCSFREICGDLCALK